MAPKRLAQALAVTSPNLTQVLLRLHERGLITRDRNPADGRSHHVVIGPKGGELAREAMAAAELMELEMQSDVSRAEHAMLIGLLGKLTETKGKL
ncbi:MAG: MarR family transcriptional regulator [Burkholderiaceae bacterium]